MSREFGEHGDFYFHRKISDCADDCAGGHDALTRALEPLFRALEPIAYAIASSEAGDWSQGSAILATLEHLPAVTDALRGIEDHLKPFRDVARAAVEAKTREETT